MDLVVHRHHPCSAHCLVYLRRRKPCCRMTEKLVPFMGIFYVVISLIVIFSGALVPMGAAWALAEIAMGGMTIVTLQCEAAPLCRRCIEEL